MQHNRILQFGFVLAIFSLVFCFRPLSTLALDVNNERPIPYWGLASGVWKEGATNFTIYSEPEATIVIRNIAPTTLPDLLFNSECKLDQPASVSPCFYLFGPSGAKLFNSRAYANDFLKSAAAVLNYAPTNVIGDSYMASDLSNFAYWGKHLRQTADQSDSNAFWQQKSYQFNKEAQAYWNTDDPGKNKNQKMSETISRLLVNAKDASAGPNGILIDVGAGVYKWLARPLSGVCGNADCSDKNQYPEGVVWGTKKGCVGCTSVSINNSGFPSGPVKYKDKATLVVKSGNLAINDSITADTSDPSAAIGFIVENGDVIISNLNKNKTLTVRASIFAPNGVIKVYGGNVDLIGSFVAKNFNVYDVGQGIVASNVNFIYDSRGENAFPPGFRDLQVLSRQTD